MRHNMTFVRLLVSASPASADKGQIPSLASGWPKTEGFWHVFPRHHCSGHLLECKDGVVACLELRRPPVSCGQGCFENNSLIWKCFVNFDKCEFVNDKISVLQEWWLSGSQKWRLRDLNVLIIWPVPAGMNYRHKSRRAVPPGSASVQRQPYGIILPLISSETCHTSCVWLATRWICKGGNTWERPFIITFKRER